MYCVITKTEQQNKKKIGCAVNNDLSLITVPLILYDLRVGFNDLKVRSLAATTSWADQLTPIPSMSPGWSKYTFGKATHFLL